MRGIECGQKDYVTFKCPSTSPGTEPEPSVLCRSASTNCGTARSYVKCSFSDSVWFVRTASSVFETQRVSRMPGPFKRLLINLSYSLPCMCEKYVI